MLARRRLESHRIRVHRNYSRGEFGTPKSRGSSRSVPMIGSLATELRIVYGRTHRRDTATTQRYADYAPSPHEEEMVAAAFGREARSTGEVPLRLVEG